MSDSTKKMLAHALRSLMLKRPLSRITVGDICELCDMNRKSFYYHFHDKYELVNWIFRRELAESLAANRSADSLMTLCSYLHDQYPFYRSALQQTEQNPLCLCMDDTLRPILAERMSPDLAQDDPAVLAMCAHSVRCLIVRWINSGCTQSVPEFIRTLYRSFAQLNRLAM